MSWVRPGDLRGGVLGFSSDVLPRGLRDEAVADAADGQEVFGVGGVVLDVAAEADDEGVYGARVCVLAKGPDLFEYLTARDGAARVGKQIAQELRLHQGQAAHTAVRLQLQPAGV